MVLHSRFCLVCLFCGCCCSVLVYCTVTRVTVALNRGPTGMTTTAYPLPQNYTMKWPGTEDDLVQTSGKVPPWFHQREYTLRNLSYYENLWFHHHANGTLISNTPFPPPPPPSTPPTPPFLPRAHVGLLTLLRWTTLNLSVSLGNILSTSSSFCLTAPSL